MFAGALLVFTPVASAETTIPVATTTPTPDQSSADNEAAITAKQKEIAALDKQISDLRGKRATTANEAAIIANQVARIQGQLQKAELELKRTQLSIRGVRSAQVATEDTIGDLQKETDHIRGKLRDLIKLLYEKEQTSMMALFLSQGTFSGMLAERAAVTKLQDDHITMITDLHQKENELQAEQQKLEQQQTDLSQLSQLQAAQQTDLAAQRKENEAFLKAKRDEQLAYDKKIAEADAK